VVAAQRSHPDASNRKQFFVNRSEYEQLAASTLVASTALFSHSSRFEGDMIERDRTLELDFDSVSTRGDEVPGLGWGACAEFFRLVLLAATVDVEAAGVLDGHASCPETARDADCLASARCGFDTPLPFLSPLWRTGT